MKERPILMSAPMVNAILAGKKTQTRRIVEPQPEVDEAYGPYLWPSHKCKSMVTTQEMRSLGPYGARGDRLWVKEAIRRTPGPPESEYDFAEYIADGALTSLDTWPWRRDQLPGMFMPRWASRITLDVTGVRVERLQDISELDALAEGCVGETVDGVLNGVPGRYVVGPARDEYAKLWRAINGEQSWDANPWVWCIEFPPFEAAAKEAA